MNGISGPERTAGLLALHGSLFTKLNQEGDGIWARFNMIVATNLALFAGFGAIRLHARSDELRLLLYAICGVGVLLCCWSVYILGRLWKWHGRWYDQLTSIERSFPVGLPRPLTDSAGTRHKVRTAFHTYTLSYTQPIMLGFAVAWLLIILAVPQKTGPEGVAMTPSGSVNEVDRVGAGPLPGARDSSFVSGARVDWAALGAIATAASGVFILLSVGYLALQVRGARDALRFRALWDSVQKLQQEDVRTARRKTINDLSKKKMADWSEEETAYAELVCHTFDSVGQLVKHGFLKSEDIINEWGDSLRRCWHVLQPLQAKRAEAWPHAWDDFKSLGEAATSKYGKLEWPSYAAAAASVQCSAITRKKTRCKRSARAGDRCTQHGAQRATNA